MSPTSSERVRRQAAVVYADVTGSTTLANRLDPEEAHALIAEVVATLERVAREFGAGLVNYRGDAILALFGIPMAQEEAVRAALNAAIEMVARVGAEGTASGRAGLSVHVGVSTGVLVAGDVSGSDKPEIDVMGGAVPLAARLSDKAPASKVYVGPELRRHAPEAFEFRAVGSIRLKGIDEPVETFELLTQTPQIYRSRAGAPQSRELVGRGDLLARLEASVAALQQGPGGVLPLMGGAGIGKSRLLAALRERVEQRGGCWLEGRCVSNGAQLSFHPFADLIRSWAGFTDPTAAGVLESLTEKVRAALGADAAEAVPYLAMLCGVPLPEAPPNGFVGPDGGATERLINLSFGRLVAALAKRSPVVMAIEDLHWADASSLALLEALAELTGTSSFLLLPTLRPERLADWPELEAGLRERIKAEAIQLAPLDAEASLALARSLLEGVRPTVIERIAQEGAGNPFFLEELARSVSEHGGPEDAAAHLEKSLSMREVVLARVDRLPAGAKQLLEIASVLGTGFSRGLLGQLAGGEADWSGDLAPLLEAELLHETDASTGELDFRHAVLREVVYDSVLLTRRRSLHLEAARALEEALPADFPGRAARLALHYTRGEDAQRAEALLLQAGAEAGQGASRESLFFFREAARLFAEREGEASDPETLRALNRGLANALFDLGEVREAVPYFDAVLESLGIARKSEARLRARVARLVARLGVEAATGWPPRRRTPSARDKDVISLAFRRALCHVTTDPTAYVLLGMDSLARVRRFDPAQIPGSGGMYSAAMVMFSLGGISFRIAERMGQQAEPLINPGNWNEQLWFEAMRFVHRMIVGDWGAELEIPPEKIDEAVARGELWVPISYLGLAARKLGNQGRFDEAEAALARIADIEERHEYELARSNRESARAGLHLERRELAEAQAIAHVYHSTHDEEPFQILGAGLKAKAQALAGDLSGAEESVKAGEAIVARTPFVTAYHATPLRLARLLLDLLAYEAALDAKSGAGAAARQATRSTQRALRMARWHAAEQPEAYRLAGRLAWLRGRQREADRWWKQSLERAEALGMGPERARTLLEIAECVEREKSGVWEGRSAQDWRVQAIQLLADAGLGAEAGLRRPPG